MGDQKDDVSEGKVRTAEEATAKKKKVPREAGLACSCLMVIGTVGIMNIIFWSIVENYKGTQVPTTSELIKERIVQLQKSIADLKSMESLLETMKSDLRDTQIQRDKIMEEYKETLELKNLTDKQINAISLVMTKKSFKQLILDNAAGFIAGVASSLAATVIYSRWWPGRKPA